MNCKEEEWKDLLNKCEEYLEHNDTNQSDRNIHNLDGNTPDGLIGEYDTKSQSIIYKPNTITNFGLYTTARNRSIAKSCKYAIESIKKLRVKFEQYVSRMYVLGFCSSNYDTVLISKKLAMKMDLDKIGYVIKTINTYLCMENEKLRFLDLANYLSRATSYAQFLASFAVGEHKGLWLYDYITNIDQLNEPLPPIGPTWFSQLKNRSVLGTT